MRDQASGLDAKTTIVTSQLTAHTTKTFLKTNKGYLMKKIYVAGPYSANNVLDVLKNIGRGEKACSELFSLGYAPFCPWHDKSYVTDNPEGEFTVKQFYDYSMAWLEVSDAVLLLPGWELSKGTLKEVERAKELDIPIYTTIKQITEFTQ